MQRVLELLRSDEDNLIERKPDSDPREWRKTIVAFANSLISGQTAWLFIGVGNRGEILGVNDPDTVQKQIGDICANQCYPPIRPHPRSHVIEEQGKKLVAVEIQSSDNRPHFAGPAYVRSGSRSVLASEQLYKELIDSRHSKARVLLEWKWAGNGLVKVVALNKRLGEPHSVAGRHREWTDCTILECNAQFVRFRSTAGTEFDEPLAGIEITGKEPDGKLVLHAKPI